MMLIRLLHGRSGPLFSDVLKADFFSSCSSFTLSPLSFSLRFIVLQAELGMICYNLK